MKIKQKIISFALLLGVATVVVPMPAKAAECAGVSTAIISCGPVGNTSAKDSGVWHLMILALNILTAGVGILAVGGIAYGAALYASSADKPEQAKAGMTYIQNVVIGLVAYGLMFVLLNFLIPGGIFSQ